MIQKYVLKFEFPPENLKMASSTHPILVNGGSWGIDTLPVARDGRDGCDHEENNCELEHFEA